MITAKDVLKLVEGKSLGDQLKKLLSAKDIKTLKDWVAGELEIEGSELEGKLYDFYLNSGEMPTGVAKGRSGVPLDWIFDRIQKDLKL